MIPLTMSKKVIEITNSATSTMLDKADDGDIAEFQGFTVRNLDNKLSTESDIDQYKLLNVREDPIDNRQQHLDVMCFPVLFPTGRFGKYHSREVKISHSENIGCSIETHILENIHSTCSICFGRKKCRSLPLVYTIC